MKIKIITIGKPKFNDIFQDFLKRISAFNDVKHLVIQKPKKEIKKILEQTKSYKKILLDERGKEFDSKEFAVFLENKKNNSENLAFFIGGPDGHEDEIKNIADFKISLSKLTLPHDFAMIFLVETLYRSLSINHNHPYHRE